MDAPFPSRVSGGSGSCGRYSGDVIYLLRHGDAEVGHGDDAARRLTKKGERQSVAAGQAIAATGKTIDTCIASTRVRAADTATLVCNALGLTPELTGALRGGPFDAAELAAGRGNVLLVGHEPDFSNEIARLTGARVKLKKGGLAILDQNTLHALLRPGELELIAARG